MSGLDDTVWSKRASEIGTAYSNAVQITVNKCSPSLKLEATPTATPTYPGDVVFTATLSGADDNSGKPISFTIDDGIRLSEIIRKLPSLLILQSAEMTQEITAWPSPLMLQEESPRGSSRSRIHIIHCLNRTVQMGGM